MPNLGFSTPRLQICAIRNSRGLNPLIGPLPALAPRVKLLRESKFIAVVARGTVGQEPALTREQVA
jgi:hypothetical protein